MPAGAAAVFLLTRTLILEGWPNMDYAHRQFCTWGFLLILALALIPAGSSAADQTIPRDSKGLPLWEVARWNDAPVRL